MTEMELHRTRLHTLDRKIFSVLFSYKQPRQHAPCLGFLKKPATEKSEKNFSVFQLRLLET
ncbi:hypothetical protein [Serratia aquatilis]|uniref:Uncharacterized protein n=1 Tax=Serratia aquatilis TaxID=1737515 RepID=A0ABV6E8L1_9GAMM